MELNDYIAMSMAEMETQYAEFLEKAVEESENPLFISKNGSVYLDEALLGVVLANTMAMQKLLNGLGMTNVAIGLQSLVILMEAIHDTAHLKAVPHA